MRRLIPFRDMQTAPRDGTTVEIRYGISPNQGIVRAHWSGQGQAFVADDDPLRRSLQGVTGWRPATGAPRPFRPITSAPTDVAVEVIYGPSQAVAVAKWDAKRQLWVRTSDPAQRALKRVTGWRSVE